MKPNSLFRNKDSDMKDASMESDINSNASEFGTLIGAPSLMAERFAEVDEMERAGKLAMQDDQDFSPQQIVHDDDILLNHEMDPDLANYKAFRANDDDDDDDDDEDQADANDTNLEIDESLFSDPFQTPSSVAPTAASRYERKSGAVEATEREESLTQPASSVAGSLHRSPTEKESLHLERVKACLLYTSPSPRDQRGSRMPSSA